MNESIGRIISRDHDSIPSEKYREDLRRTIAQFVGKKEKINANYISRLRKGSLIKLAEVMNKKFRSGDEEYSIDMSFLEPQSPCKVVAKKVSKPVKHIIRMTFEDRDEKKQVLDSIQKLIYILK